MATRCKLFKIRNTKSTGQPDAKPVRTITGGTDAKLRIGETKREFEEGLFSNTNGNGAPKMPFGPGGSNLTTFNFGAPANEVKTNKNMQLKARRLISYVYKCHACSLCFHQQEAMFQHLSNCSPSKKITKILCICGLDFDKQNYEYHCEVHRKCTTLKKKDVTINDDQYIDVGGMVNKFINDEQETISDDDKFKTIDAHDKFAEDPNIFENRNKSCVVYRCNCRLCFERPEFLFSHLSSCDPAEKITRIHCMCGLEFDKHNYDHHCKVHRKFKLLHVKKITVSDDEIIHISGMWQEFAKDDENKVAKSTKEAQAQTDITNEAVDKIPALGHGFDENGTFEQLLGNKIVKAVLETIECGIDGKNETKITITIANASEKNSSPNKAKKEDENNVVTDVSKSETIVNHKAADNTINSITPATEGHHNATDNHEAPDIASNGNTVLNQLENKAINNSEPTDSKTNQISAHTLTTPEKKVINGLEITDGGPNEVGRLNDLSNKIHSNQEKSISTNFKDTIAPTPTIPANENINHSEAETSGTNEVTELIDRLNKITDNEENSDIPTLTPFIRVNKIMNNSESIGDANVIDGTDKTNDSKENADASTQS